MACEYDSDNNTECSGELRPRETYHHDKHSVMIVDARTNNASEEYYFTGWFHIRTVVEDMNGNCCKIE